ncbi:MAG: DNA recombination protein RmuC [Bacillota bacterium]|nr:DNA recombination protein RmuC [Bacillota bacterium]
MEIYMEYLCIALAVTTVFLFIIVILLATRKPSGNSELIREEFATERRDNLEQFRQNREELAGSVSRLSASIEARLENQNRRLDLRLAEIEERNEKTLGQIRETVDEKLHKTLDERLGQSFKTVSDRLEQVSKGLGEMQNLAVGVGDLKKVLTNVKSRGVLGELQLERLLEQMLAPEQYEKNVATKPGSGQSVEFAVKLPVNGKIILLPIDSKFPVESYSRLLSAYENSTETVDTYAKELEDTLKKSAKDISEKYINPPLTTDYAIMFLPTEGLYCEAVRRDGLIETLQMKYHVMISGPTTLTAMLSSLQMGFRTVAIEKRASEVWITLSSVKKEFEKFADILSNTQRHISMVSDDVDKLIGVRTRSIIKKLNDVEEVDIISENVED